MAERIANTAHRDAPLATAKHPDATAVANTAQADDTLVARTVTINRPRDALYAFWRDFGNLPRFMHHVERVDVKDSSRSHWVVAAPAGQSVEWDSLITEDVPNEMIAWTSEPGASVRNSGRVEFTDSSAGRGTMVTVTLAYDPPGGSVGKLIAKLFQREPKVQARQDLRRFKQLMETGEVATADPPDAAPRAGAS
jgi:uncharacterized membrane protein